MTGLVEISLVVKTKNVRNSRPQQQRRTDGDNGQRKAFSLFARSIAISSGRPGRGHEVGSAKIINNNQESYNIKNFQQFPIGQKPSLYQF